MEFSPVFERWASLKKIRFRRRSWAAAFFLFFIFYFFGGRKIFLEKKILIYSPLLYAPGRYTGSRLFFKSLALVFHTPVSILSYLTEVKTRF